MIKFSAKIRRVLPVAVLATSIFTTAPVHATPNLIAIGTLGNTTDLSGLTSPLENGVDTQNVIGGIGSGLAWAGGTTFLALPDRGPNATGWNTNLDNTTSYVSRFQTVNLALTQTPSGGLPFTLSPTLSATTLLSSSTALNYAAANAANNNIAGAPSINTASQYYFTGRSDNFAGTGSLNGTNGRLDPEGIRVSNDGTKVYVSDEYGPYVYEFDRATGLRTRTFTLPSEFGIATLNSIGATEISGNTSGRVANKGMEGLAITPDGKTLVGFMQSPLIQDGGDGGRANRIISIDIASGATHQYVYDNFLTDTAKAYNSSEILAINSHEFLVLERDGKGLGDGTSAVVKRMFKIDLNGATDISTLGLSGEANLLPYAVTKSLFLDIKAALNAGGVTNTNVPAKLEGAAWGDDVNISGTNYHTLYIANDNDFIPGTAGPSKYFVFAVSDADLGGSTFQNQAVPEPATVAFLACGLAAFLSRRHRRRTA